MGSGSSTKSDSAHRIEVVRGPRRTLIRLTGSFLVLLTPPPSHSLLGALLLSVRRPRFLPLPIRENVRANKYIYIGNGCDSIDRELFFFSRLFRRGRKTRSVSVCLHKRAPPRFNSWKTFYSIVRQIWVAVKKNKKKKERAVYREKGGGRRGREWVQVDVKPSAKFPFYRRDAKLSTTIASFTSWQWGKKGFEFSNTIIFFPDVSFSYDVSKERIYQRIYIQENYYFLSISFLLLSFFFSLPFSLLLSKEEPQSCRMNDDASTKDDCSGAR